MLKSSNWLCYAVSSCVYGDLFGSYSYGTMQRNRFISLSLFISNENKKLMEQNVC